MVAGVQRFASWPTERIATTIYQLTCVTRIVEIILFCNLSLFHGSTPELLPWLIVTYSLFCIDLSLWFKKVYWLNKLIEKSTWPHTWTLFPGLLVCHFYIGVNRRIIEALLKWHIAVLYPYGFGSYCFPIFSNTNIGKIGQKSAGHRVWRLHYKCVMICATWWIQVLQKQSIELGIFL